MTQTATELEGVYETASIITPTTSSARPRSHAILTWRHQDWKPWLRTAPAALVGTTIKAYETLRISEFATRPITPCACVSLSAKTTALVPARARSRRAAACGAGRTRTPRARSTSARESAAATPA
jgi:hypothetical protein